MGAGDEPAKRFGAKVKREEEMNFKISAITVLGKFALRIRLTMQATVQTLLTNFVARRPARAMVALGLLLMLGCAESGLAQTTPPLNIFKNYFVTGDYVVAGWVEQSSASGFASGTISIPDCRQATFMSQACPPPPPAGADIVAAYLYWGTVEGSQSSFAGQTAFFNGYKIVGTVLGNPNAPTSWSSGGCTGSSTGSKTMRFYRADVRPYMPLDLISTSATFGALRTNLTSPSVTVKLADSGSTGNTQPNALGATLVLIYRVLSPSMPLNAIVLYDGSYAPSNTQPTMLQNLVGFYQPAQNPTDPTAPTAKITHIVANGQLNKGQTVYFGNDNNPQNWTPLPSLYTQTLGASAPPFPGIYGAWDNPTWPVGTNRPLGNLMNVSGLGFGSQTTSVVPTSSNSGCVNWGAIVLSTTVQDSGNDGLLDVWESKSNSPQGYTDAVSGQFVALPGADPNAKDLFVEVDYLTLRDSTTNNVLHSHLPKQAALDAVAQAFAAQTPPINVHFERGNEIPESALLCSDASGRLCAFPNQPAVSWKGGFESVKNDPALGKFQPGRAQSYRYLLSGHSLGEPRSYWGTAGTAFAGSDSQVAPSMPQLISIVDTGTVATVTIKSPSLLGGPPGVAPLVPPLVSPLVLKPGDCLQTNPPHPLPAACSDANKDRVTISGALIAPFVAGTGQQPAPPLNGTYTFSNVSSDPPDSNGIITTRFDITTSGVADGTYSFNNEPQLGVSYLGPTSSSGHADFGGGGDFAMTLGLWGADDDPSGCQPDPSLSPTSGQTYCNNQVGTLNVQTGTLMHELGHTLTLTHGGTYYPANSSVPTYEGNCKPNFISVMNYLFQIRGFVDDLPYKFDYSGQTLAPLNETTSTVTVNNVTVPPLSESAGLGVDAEAFLPAAHLTRWYSAPNAADVQLQDQALAHCDGSPMATGEAAAVRVDGTLALPGGPFSAPLDWNNDLTAPTTVVAPGEDLNHSGIIGDSPFSGFNDWHTVDLQQMNARASGFGFSEGGGLQRGGGGLQRGGGGIDNDGGGLQRGGGGLQRGGGGLQRGGGGLQRGGGGIEQDTETANSTVNSPTGLTCTQPLTTTSGTVVPGCSSSSGSLVEKAKSVPLTWSAPNFGQIREYAVWRAVGSFTTSRQVFLNVSKFSKLTTLTGPQPGTPPLRSFIDNFNLKANTTYTYFVTDANSFGARSGSSTPLVVLVKF